MRSASQTAPSFVQVGEEEGLADSDVRVITQDQQGFIWLGLRLGGLARFDGYDLKIYQHDPSDPTSLGNRVIWSVLVDRGGTLWVGTEGGLDRFDRSTDSFIHHRANPEDPRALPHPVIVCLFQDSAGRVWVGSRGGLSRLDDAAQGLFTTFRRPQVVTGSAANDTIRSITEDPETGLLWLGTSDGLAAFDPRTGAFATYVHRRDDPESLSRNSVNKVLRDENGTFWALTEYGLNSFHPSLTAVPEHTSQPPRITFRRHFATDHRSNPGGNFFREGLVDRNGQFWLATRGGLHVLDRAAGTFTTHRRSAEPNGLSDDILQAVFEDHMGNLWFGTLSGGANVIRAHAKPFRSHQYQPDNYRSLSEDRVTGLALDPSGRLWVATRNGLNFFDGRTWKRFQQDTDDPETLPTDDLASVAVAANGDVWIGTTYHGVYRYDGRRFHSYESPASIGPVPAGRHAFTGSQVNSLLPDGRGGMWVAARAYGIDHYTDGAFQHYPPRGAGAGSWPTNNAVLGVYQPDGSLWFVTEFHGLVHLGNDGETFTVHAVPPEMSSGAPALQCITAGDRNTLWIGGADGLLEFDTHSQRFVRRYGRAAGIGDAVVSIVRDRSGRLWLGTANGLLRFDPDTTAVRRYDRHDGLPSNVFSPAAAELGPDGRLYFGTRSGVLEFDPEQLPENTVPPRVVLTELRWLGGARRGSSSAGDVGEEIEVSPGQPGFSLKFSALDFTAPEKNQFRHKLEGWDTDWVPSNADTRSATYTALPPGKYVFRVLASNADGVWNTEGASVRIHVLPRLWQTASFRIIAAGILVGLVASGLHWRLRGVRRQNLRLEAEVSQRTQQLQREVQVRQQAESALRESHAQLERRVQERTAELAQSNASLQAEIAERKHVEAQLRQSQKMEAIGQLAGGVAHDFNNLLTVILGQIDLMENVEMSPEERAAAIHDITAAAQRASNLTRQLLVFSRQQTLNPTALDLNHVVTDVCKLLTHVIGERIKLEKRLHQEPLGTRADPGMLEQVLLNLALNARDAMPRGGQLTITTGLATLQEKDIRGTTAARPGVYSVVSVSDSGTGIAENILPQIFEPFFTTKESGKGTGLGLAISLGIVQKHGGWMDVETQVGRGTTFYVYLPTITLPKVQTGPAARPPRPKQGDTTVLLVEDEQAVRHVVKTVLTRQGYQVIEAGSAAEALSAWSERREAIALLLTDIVMPGLMDGHELAARLSAEKPDVKVITMSGYDPNEVSQPAAKGKARPHLRKPFTADALLQTVESILRR